MSEAAETVEARQANEGENDWRAEFFNAQEKHQEELARVRQDAYDKARADVERETSAFSIGERLGYPKIGPLFLKQRPDLEPTEENIRAFVSDELGLDVDEASVGEEENEEPHPQPVVATGNVGNFHQAGGVPAGSPRYTAREIYEDYKAGNIDRGEFNRRVEQSIGLRGPR